MFYLQFTGTTNDAVTNINAMTSSSGTSADTALLAAAKTAAIAAINGNYLQGLNYSGNVQLLIRGGWQDGSTSLSIKLNNIDLTVQGKIITGDPTTRLFPQ